MGLVSSAIVIARIKGLEDPRKIGWDNLGGTNVLRYDGKLAAALIATWIVVAALFSLFVAFCPDGGLLAPVYVWWVFPGQLLYLSMSVAMGALLVWRHRSNIQKLLAGKESKIGRQVS